MTARAPAAGRAARPRRALLLYPSQLFCADPETYPVVIRTQLVKLYSYLRAAGVPEVRIIDLELELGRPTSEAEVAWFVDEASRLIGREPYDFIGISCYTSVSYTATLEVVEALRELQPDALVAVGGYHCLSDPEDFEDVAGIDFVVRGDGLQFLESLLRGEPLPRVASFTGSAPDPQPMRYDEYPYRYRELPAVAHLQLSRGCPFTCAFCCEPFLGNSRYTPLEVDDALAQVDEVVRVFQPDKVILEDLLFGFHARWRHEFLEALRDRRYPQIFWAEMRADTVTERTAELLAQQNFELTIGLEAASPATLLRMRKAKEPESYIRSFHRLADVVQAKGVPTTFTIMLNYPGETLSSFDETMTNIEATLARHARPYFRFDFLEYEFYPGNETHARIDDLAAEHGTEIGDRRWYARRDGRMLEEARCSVPSIRLVDEVGAAAVHTYFEGRASRVRRRQDELGELRTRLFRSYRFVRRLQRRLPALGAEDLLARFLSREASRVARGVALAASLHRGLARSLGGALEEEGGPSWKLRAVAWETALDWICDRVGADELASPASLAILAAEADALAREPQAGELLDLCAPRARAAERRWLSLV